MKSTLSNYQSDIGLRYMNLDETVQNYKLSISLIGYTLRHDLKDINNQNIEVQSDNKNKTIYFYFTETGCNSCIVQELENLTQVSKNSYNIIVLARYSDPIRLAYLLKDYNIPNLKYHCLPIDCEIFESKNQEYLPLTLVFNLDDARKVSNPLVASSESPEISKFITKD
ncbi:hypothetical protein KUH03_11045 [Sphingobacterium sp. E70]|uniref:hypothetical protein n=1 Tax=Sphingobacterium sp. E70 TaxID=2853439 RepID=UPI00211BD9F6|nr:hypothetical protein [Sphingobacterium sp. E70]ULT27236.1 hypothetical protein KUH03_11045 [Sphingobacterium sp. E70]